MYEIKNSKEVELTDNIRFRCKRCGECCRNVKASVVVEPYDIYRIAKYFDVAVDKIYTDYTDVFFLENTCFPIFALKTTKKKDACIFLRGNRCSIQEVKPRTCKIYPFWVGPSDKVDEFTYNYSFEKKHHPNGSLVKVKEWMRKNFTPEDRNALMNDYRYMQKIAILINTIQKCVGDNDKDLLYNILLYRYYNFDTKIDFFHQQKENYMRLESYLLCKSEKLTKTDKGDFRNE